MFIPSTAEGSGWEIDTQIAASGAGAVWQRARFGTVRPRVQIPGPRPKSEFRIADVEYFDVIGPLYDCIGSAAVLLDGDRLMGDIEAHRNLAG